jgi:hypothetical protein
MATASENLHHINRSIYHTGGSVADGQRVYLRLYAQSIGMQRKGKQLREQIERSKIPVVPPALTKKITKKEAENLFSRLHEQAVKKKFQKEIAIATAEVTDSTVSTPTIDENTANKLYDRLYSTPIQKQDSLKSQDSKEEAQKVSSRTINENSAKQLYNRLHSETLKQDGLKIQEQREPNTEKREKASLVIDEREAQELFDRLYNEKMGKAKK